MEAFKVKFNHQAFPKMLADLSHSNQFLKIFALASLAISLGLLILVSIALSRGPMVIAFASDARVLQSSALPDPNAEVAAAVRAYVERRYNWDQSTVDRQLDSAKAFIAPAYVQNFVQGVSNVRKFSKEKFVAQRAHASSLSVDLKRGVVSVSGDRISEIQGIRAAGALNIDLNFQSGPRTQENPWGVYIVKETER